MMGFWSSLRAVLCIIVGTVADSALASDAAQLNGELLGALDKLILEEDARKVIEPYMDKVKQLDTAVVEKIVFKQWWQLAQELIAKSHLQNADLSVAVRKAVRTLKDEADELLRTLNPKYGQAQLVAPAFQWAQNDTCVFLTVKFTVRWNAPGALEVSEPAVQIEGNKFNFTGLGKHSNNKYKYQLALKLFDNLSPSDSQWNTASVGKLSVTLRKKWPRKWPRLLQDKKAKISNMHVWMETQDRLNGQLGGLSTVSHSPVTCSETKKLYCTVTDTCKLPANCSQCPGKPEPVEDQHVCAGVPSQKATASFKDSDMDKEEYGGAIKVTKDKHDFESESFIAYWGRDMNNKIDAKEDLNPLIGEATAHHTSDAASINIKFDTKKPDEATHFLVFSKNAYGEHASPSAVELRDAYLPQHIMKGVTFQDDDGEKGEIQGSLHVEKPDDDSSIDKYVIHWGKSETQRIDRRKNMTSHLADFDKSVTYHIPGSTKIPEQATHLLVYCRNEHGEHPTPVSVKIVDNLYPCMHVGNEDCPSGVSIAPSADGTTKTVSIQRAKEEAGLSAYTLYWGRAPCDNQGPLRNGHLKYMPIAEHGLSEPVDYELPAGIEVPDGTTHILAFSQNRFGESKFCTSQSFERDVPSTPSNTAEDAHSSADGDNAEAPPSTDSKQEL